jgi:hypothetical protein
MAPPTRGSYALGGLAASWVALECERILRCGQAADALAGREVLLAVGPRQMFVTQRRRNPACRFDHQTWRIAPFEGLTLDASLADALALACRMRGARKSVSLGLPGLRLAKAVHCPGCGAMVDWLHLVGRHDAAKCPRCRRHELVAVGFKLVDRVDRNLPQALARQPLRQIGFRGGDVFAVTSKGATGYLEIPRDEA